MNADRYIRQTTLPEVGAEGQARLRAAHVLVIGAGGLGVPVLEYLTGAGIGHITVIDPDNVSRTNLHRQTLYREGDLGKPKAEAAAASLVRLNPECRLTPLTAMFDPANAGTLTESADLVLDCADSFAASYIASDTCFALGKPFISASALGLSGYAGGFCAGVPSLRALFPDLPDNTASCASAGVLGPVVGILGALQAQMALTVLLDLKPSPLGQLVTFDAKGFRFGSFRFDAAPEPDSAYRFIAAEGVTDKDCIIDLRDTDEAPQVFHPAARRGTVGGLTLEPAHGQRAVLACRSGLRAWRAADKLREVWQGDLALVALGDTFNGKDDP